MGATPTLPTFGFLTSLIDIHFPGPSGPPGPHVPTYPSYFIYNPLQPTLTAEAVNPAYTELGGQPIYAIPGDPNSLLIGFTPDYSTFNGFQIISGKQIGFPDFATAFKHVGACYGPFTQSYAQSLADQLNNFQIPLFSYISGFRSTQASDGSGDWIPPVAVYNGPDIQSIPGPTTKSGYQPGSLFPGLLGTVFIAEMGAPPDDLFALLVYLQEGLGVLPQGYPIWQVGGPVPYQSSSPPYDGN